MKQQKLDIQNTYYWVTVKPSPLFHKEMQAQL